jgi:hypothetical protein
MLDKYITNDVLPKIAQESVRGRRLFIGTTNLDADRAVIRDMSAIATSHKPGRLKLLKQLVLASTSIPASFRRSIWKSRRRVRLITGCTLTAAPTTKSS